MNNLELLNCLYNKIAPIIIFSGFSLIFLSILMFGITQYLISRQEQKIEVICEKIGDRSLICYNKNDPEARQHALENLNP